MTATTTRTLVYSWDFQSQSRSFHLLPDGSGEILHREWGGAGGGQPWTDEWTETLSREEAAEELARWEQNRQF
jgi:hypothetical protein